MAALTNRQRITVAKLCRRQKKSLLIEPLPLPLPLTMAAPKRTLEQLEGLSYRELVEAVKEDRGADVSNTPATAYRLLMPRLSMAHFRAAFAGVETSVDEEDLARFAEWEERWGASPLSDVHT